MSLMSVLTWMLVIWMGMRTGGRMWFRLGWLAAVSVIGTLAWSFLVRRARRALLVLLVAGLTPLRVWRRRLAAAVWNLSVHLFKISERVG